MSKEKLIYVTPIPPPFGGIAILSESILNAGLKDKFDVIQIVTSKKALSEKIDSIRFSGIITGIQNYFKLISICLKNPKAKYAFVTGTSNLGILRDFWFILILAIFRKKILFNLHGTRKLKTSNFLVKIVSKIAMKLSYKILSPTKIDFEAAKIFFKNENKIKLFYNSTFIPEHLTNSPFSQTENERKTLKIIGIGRLSDAKGAFDLIDVCIELLNENHNIELTWIGRGAYESDDINARGIIAKSGFESKISLLRDLTEEEKYKEIHKADLFILPTKNDNLPVSILEAMACGKPIISSIMGAIPEVIIDNVNGWLIEHNNKLKLKEIIVEISTKKKSIKTIGGKNIEDFNKIFASQNRINDIESFLKLNYNE